MYLKSIALVLQVVLLLAGLSNGNEKERIYNGIPAELGQFPYIAGIKPDDINAAQPACTGAIISPRHILSEAWCINYATINMTVVVGCVAMDSEDCVAHDVETITFHPNYTVGSLMDFDVAILTLTEDIAFNANVDTIEVSYERVPPGQSMVISGWDYDNKILTYTNVVTGPEEECNYFGAVNPMETLCTSPNSQLFWADWGAPVVNEDGKVVALAVQFGERYDYHLRIENYMDFIKGD